MKRDLLSKPEFFCARANADGRTRFYWRASRRIAPMLLGSGQPWAKGLVRLADDRAAAEAECRAITAAVKDYIARGLDTRTNPLAAADAYSLSVLRAVPGTLAHAIAAYKASKAYAGVEPRTKRQYDWVLGMVEQWGGHKKLAEVAYKSVWEAARRLEAKPRTQQLFLALLAMVIDRAAHEFAAPGEIVSNPVRLVLREIEKPEAGGGWVWPRAAIPAFVRAAEVLGRASIGTAIVLNEWLAQRTSDLLALPRSAYREGVLHVVQAKTGQYVPLPLDAVASLKARLDWQLEQEAKAKVRSLTPPTLILCETTHEPWQPDHFRHEFARIRAALAGAGDAEPADRAKLAAIELWPVGGWLLDAVPRRLWRDMGKGAAGGLAVRTEDLRFGHLRHTGITRLRQAGCDDEHIRAISGHTQPATVYEHYLAVTVESARAAFGKRSAFEAKR